MRKNVQNRLSRHWSFIGFAIPIAVIGLGLVLPGGCIAGFNDLTLGFAATVLGAGIALLIGRRTSATTGGGHV